MSDRRRVEPRSRFAPGARYGAEFWDAVECEIEALDASDFEAFLAADDLPIEPRAEFTRTLGESIAAIRRARFSN
jgi:hypothetical protein